MFCIDASFFSFGRGWKNGGASPKSVKTVQKKEISVQCLYKGGNCEDDNDEEDMRDMYASRSGKYSLHDATTDDQTDTDFSSLSGSKSSYVSRNVPGNSLTDFQITHYLRTSRFGASILAYHRLSRRVVNIAVAHKYIICATSEQHIPSRETDLLRNLSHPFIIKFLYRFQDTNSLYTVSEVYPGGTLARLIHYAPHFALATSSLTFYAACILSALSYAHSRNVICRGLHAESILIDASGYVAIADWSFAKYLRSDKTYTVCGALEYRCPESMQEDGGYGRGADHWAFGVLLFELLTGCSPFAPHGVKSRVSAQHEITVRNAILQGDIMYPPSDMCAAARDLINGLLVREPSQRLGNDGIADIINHRYFVDMDWNKLVTRSLTPPWTPTLTNLTDTRYYDESCAMSCLKDVPLYQGYNIKEWNDFGPIVSPLQ